MVQFTLPKNSKVRKGKAWNPPPEGTQVGRWREYRRTLEHGTDREDRTDNPDREDNPSNPNSPNSPDNPDRPDQG